MSMGFLYDINMVNNFCDDCGQRIAPGDNCQHYNNDLGIRCQNCADKKAFADWKKGNKK